MCLTELEEFTTNSGPIHVLGQQYLARGLP